MLATIQKTVEEQHELELPAYFEYGSGFVKVISEGDFIEVSKGDDTGLSIKNNFPQVVSLYISKGTPITADTFYKRFDEVLEQIENLKQPA